MQKPPLRAPGKDCHRELMFQHPRVVSYFESRLIQESFLFQCFILPNIKAGGIRISHAFIEPWVQPNSIENYPARRLSRPLVQASQALPLSPAFQSLSTAINIVIVKRFVILCKVVSFARSCFPRRHSQLLYKRIELLGSFRMLTELDQLCIHSLPTASNSASIKSLVYQAAASVGLDNFSVQSSGDDSNLSKKIHFC